MLSGHISNVFAWTINPHGYEIEKVLNEGGRLPVG